jgi:hypothetical protein
MDMAAVQIHRTRKEQRVGEGRMESNRDRMIKFNLPSYSEGEAYMAIAKVVPLIDRDNNQVGARIISIVKIDRSKGKQKPKDLKLESVLDGEEKW